jgi:glutathione S-transferase
MVLTLYGVSGSTCTQRVGTVLHEKKVAFKFVNLDFQKGEHKSAEHLKRQPFGQVPALDVRRILFVKCLVLTLYI